MQKTATMSVLSPAASHHAVGIQADVLHRIADPAVNLSLWQRQAQPAISGELSGLEASQLPDMRHRTTLDSFDDDVCALLQRQGLDPRSFKNLRADLRGLALLFFPVSEGRDVKFRLVATDGDNCRRFHVDTRHLRLICTYRGPGTEWLTDAQVDREALARGAPNDAVIRFGKPSQFQPFWVGIFRGDPDSAGRGLVHRSPPIAGSGLTRVLFSLDAEPRQR